MHLAAGQAVDRPVDPHFGMCRWAGAYPGVLFGSTGDRRDVLCGLALFAAQGPAIATALLAFFNRMVFVQSRIAMLDIFALAFGLLAVAAFIHGFRQMRPRSSGSRSRSGFGLDRVQWSRLFAVLAVCIVIVAVIRLMQAGARQFAEAQAADLVRGLVARFRYYHFATCFVLIPAVRLSRDLRALYGLSLPDLLEAQRQIFTDAPRPRSRVTPICSSSPSFRRFRCGRSGILFDKVADDRIAAVALDSAESRGLSAALPALAVCLRGLDRDVPGRRVLVSVVLCRALISASALLRGTLRLPVFLFAGRHSLASLRCFTCSAGHQPHARCYGLLSRSQARASPRCCRSRWRLWNVRWTRLSGSMLFQSWI